MCTATWIRRGAGYEFRFNRDELRARGGARAPKRFDVDGPAGRTSYVAPRDSDFGGTWIAANDRGLTLALLNGFRRSDLVNRDYRSRGLLVTDLASAVGIDEVLTRLGSESLERYRSFRLVVIGPTTPVLIAEWDGTRLEVDRDGERRLPFVSSSFEESDVGRARRAEFERLVPDPSRAAPQGLDAYHRSHANGPSAFSVCMHRTDACTRSFTRVRVDDDEVSLSYVDGPPCETEKAVECRLARVDSKPIHGARESS